MTPTRQKLIDAFANPAHGSPMESLFWAGLSIAADFRGKPVSHIYYEFQAQRGPYRLDFLFDINESNWLAVEVDGHDWHERTKEQAARDKRRDRYMVEHGIRVVRFTGSEVYANPVECGAEVLRILESGHGG